MRPRTIQVLVSCWCLAGSTAYGQSLTIDNSTSVTVTAGQDFATTVIGDPWDFSEATDYSFMFSTGWGAIPTVANGMLRGIVAAADAAHPSVQLQFEGIDGALNFVGRNGVRFPIDANTFRRLSFRMRRSPETTAPLDTLQATWYTGTMRTAALVGGKVALTRGFDPQNLTYPNQSPIASQTSSQYHIFKLDLDTGSPFKFGADWTNVVRGLGLQLGEGLAPNVLAGATIDLDWVRLTPRGTATSQLSWSGFAGPVTLTATSGADTIQIFPDNQTNATTFATAGTFTWDYGFLPPGTWTVRASGLSPGGGTISAQATLRIEPEPIINLTEPDEAGGRDYASTVIGDAWDMTNSQDMTRFGGSNNVTGLTFGGNGVTGTTTSIDPSIELIDDSAMVPGTEAIIDANTYRHLTFTIEFDRKDLDFDTALGADFGGVARVIWRRANNNGGPLTNTQDVFVLDGGPRTYSMDLASYTFFGSDRDAFTHLESSHGTDLWTGSIALLRLDPYESIQPRTFRIANVTLAADDEPNGNGFFTVKWNASAVAASTVTLYYDTDTDPNNGKTQIATNLPAAAGEYSWHVGGVTAGRYFIYAQITDPLGTTRGRYSTGPLRIATPLPVFSDTNGNGLSDAWEIAFGVTDPSGDDDLDGVDNLTEFRNATEPGIPNIWNLPEGATGFFRERIAVANPGVEPADITVTYLRESGAPIVRNHSLVGKSRLSIDVNDVAGLSDAAVSTVVETTRGAAVVERTMFWNDQTGSLYGGHTGKGIPRAQTEWFLAEGDANFFDTFILFANTNAAPANVSVTYLRDDGSTVPQSLTVGANSRVTVYTNAISGLTGRAFSTKITSDRPITVERAMYFGSNVRLFNGGHEAAAVAAPSTSWFVAEGRTGPFFEMFLLLANPGTVPSIATIKYLTPGGGVITETRTLPPTSRTTIAVDAIPGLTDTDVSASVTATQPIIVERSMFWPDPFTSWYESHNSAGVTATGTRLALAEGEVGGPLAFQTFILFANPNPTAATVTLTLLRAPGLAPISTTFTVPATSRLTRSAGEFPLGWGERFGILVDASVPIAVERAMYWDGAGEFFGGGTNETAVKLR